MKSKDELVLWNMRTGNICTLCETQISWVYEDREKDNAAVSFNPLRAVCRGCYNKLG